MRLFMRRSLENADVIVTVSDWSAARIGRAYPDAAGKVTVIPNAVDHDMAVISEDLASPAAGPYVLTVGHLEPRKNLGTLIGAFARVAPSWPGRLIIVGKDLGELPRLRRLAAGLGISDRVDFAGMLPDREVSALYRWAEVLVVPSLYEGFGMTLLEGFAHSRPVLASGIPPHVEVAGEAAAWFDPFVDGAEEQLATELIELLGDEDRRSSLAAAGARRMLRFDWNESAAQLRDLYLRMSRGESI